MTGPERYDVVIIGGGQAGPPLAHALAKTGRRAALAERRDLGGSCVNFGCTPTKAAIASARVAHDARRAAEFGLRVTGVEVDFPAVLRRAREIALESRTGLERWFAGSDNPTLLRGHAQIDGRDGDRFRLRVGDRALSATAIVIDTGTRTAVPPIDGLDTVDFIHAGNWLETPLLPRHVAMVGGGYIALEMSQFYRRMGSRVTLIERSARIAGGEDDDVASALMAVLSAEGVEFRLAARLGQVERRPTGVRLHLEQSGRAEVVDASHLFIATGRRPNTNDLGLETLGVRRSDVGFIETDRRLATSVPGIWAAGDVRGGPMFTHTAWDDYRVLMSQLAGDGSRTTERIVPYAVFTDPELGRVGMTEAEAKRAGRDVKVARFDMARNSKAREIGDPGGFIKVMAERTTGQLIGAAVLASNGGELVHLYVDLMNAGAPYTVIRDAVHIHPTLAEAVQSAVAALDGPG
jgi:pyruvate/2-oxoglutarate dehydrogenase complex dihydrolipoamide dehydrogenase (E3) component